MDIEQCLEEIWKSNQTTDVPKYLIERRFVYARNADQKDILITGINPSFRKGDSNGSFGFDFAQTLTSPKNDVYWTPVKRMLHDDSAGIDLRNQSAYLDIMFFRERHQTVLSKQILKTEDGVRFIAQQINLSQHIVEEVIQPKVIVVKNTGSHAYWGRYSDKGVFWMGYALDFIEHTYSGDLFRITGLHDHPERVAPEIEKSNLINTKVLFSHHITRWTPKEKRLKCTTLSEILGKAGS